MTPQLKFVCWFTGLQKPTGSDEPVDIAELRKQSDRASSLGKWIFDKKLSVMNVTDTVAEGVPVRIYRNSIAQNQRVMVFIMAADLFFIICRRMTMFAAVCVL